MRPKDALEKDAAETKKELAALSQTVDLLKEASDGYRVVRNRFLDTFRPLINTDSILLNTDT